jgi:hypothetical protein
MNRPVWDSPTSEDAKRQMLNLVWGTVLDTYVWYLLGDITELTADERAAIVTDMLSGADGFGDLELHQSGALIGRPTLLRLRGRVTLQPSLTIRGRYCPLYQVGIVDGDPFVNFYLEWREQQVPPRS